MKNYSQYNLIWEKDIKWHTHKHTHIHICKVLGMYLYTFLNALKENLEENTPNQIPYAIIKC